MKNLPVRKNNRLPNFDYSNAGYYFITVCVKNRHEILWDIPVGAAFGRPQSLALSEIGAKIDSEINKIEHIYDNVKIDNYVIMPNHVHLIIRLVDMSREGGRPKAAPTISRIMNQFKGSITKQIGFSIWQKLFHDHIIRNEEDYIRIWQYMTSTW